MVAIFTLNGCGHCQQLKERLSRLGIAYTSIEVNEHPDLWKAIVEHTKDDALPTVFLKNKDNADGLAYVPGRDFQSEDEIVEIIKDYVGGE
jgi:glutaredoxin